MSCSFSPSLLVLASGVLLLVGCTVEPWVETLSTGPRTYALVAGVPLDLAVVAELDARDSVNCGALYRTLYGEAVQAAPGASIAVVIDGNIDVLVLGLEAGDRIQLGDAWNFIDRAGSGCIAETGLQLLSETDQTVEIVFETVGQEAGSSGNHPGDGVFSVAIDPVQR